MQTTETRAPIDSPAIAARMLRTEQRLLVVRALEEFAAATEQLATLVEGVPDDAASAEEDAAIIIAMRDRVTELVAKYPAAALALTPWPVAVADDAVAGECVAG